MTRTPKKVVPYVFETLSAMESPKTKQQLLKEVVQVLVLQYHMIMVLKISHQVLTSLQFSMEILIPSLGGKPKSIVTLWV